MNNRSILELPLPVLRALRKLGEDIRDARRRRRIQTALMGQRAGISRMTLLKIEKGDPGVSIGSYATVLFVLGMTERLAELVDPKHDRLGRDLEDERLPLRIRQPGRGRKTGAG